MLDSTYGGVICGMLTIAVPYFGKYTHRVSHNRGRVRVLSRYNVCYAEFKHFIHGPFSIPARRS